MPAHAPRQLVLIDGHALAYRMFFALNVQHFSTSNHEPTNATYGFTRTLVNLLNEKQPPEYLAVSFDMGLTFRNEKFEDYKGTREKMPGDLRLQIDRIHQVLDAFNIPILELEGYEADDILGTIARLAGEMGLQTRIVTGDRDLLQLVDEHTLVQLPGNRSGEDQVFDVAAVREKYGLEPIQLIDLKAMIGDTSDNIPGVKGVGEKTATSLLQSYHTLDNIYEHLPEINARARTALEAGKDVAYLSYELGRIIRDVPISFDIEACRLTEFDRDQVVEIFRELEFRSLITQVPGAAESAGPTVAPQAGQQLSLFESAQPAPAAPEGLPASPTVTIIIRDTGALDELAGRLQVTEAIAFDTETTSTDQMRAELVGISLAVEPGEGYYIPVGHQIGDDPQLPLETVIEKLRPAMTDPSIIKIGHNIKYDAVILARHGLPVSPLSFDTMIAEWLINPSRTQGKLGLKAQAFIRLGIEMVEITQLIGTGKNQRTMDLVPVEQAAPYAAADADMTLRLWEQLKEELKQEEGLEDLFFQIEMPLVPVLVDMERAGVLVDTAFLEEMSKELRSILDGLMGQIKGIVGYEFNLNSTQQLSKALFEDLRLPTEGLRKTSSGHYSTAAGVLEELRSRDTTGIINLILDYREAEKLRSTYVDALPTLVNPRTGRIHSSFNQTGAITGRISSSDPNLQNIPIRTDMGRRIRDAFIAAPGNLLLAADYSQVELRILAHMSGDEALRQAFIEDQDIHATTAAAVNNIPVEEVTRAQRSFAKAVNFGLLYGMGAFRLARDSEMTLAEAEAFIKAYFERFPRVKAYLDGTRQMAAEQGYVETLLKRRRYFPALQSDVRTRQAALDRQAAEREAINMPIQGTAADIIKLAMVKLHKELHERNLGAKMILQVHDELVLEVPENEAEETLALVKEVMENALRL